VLLTGRIDAVPEPFPTELRRDRGRPPGRPVHHPGRRSVGISESCLSRWLKIAVREDGVPTNDAAATPIAAGTDLETENCELRKRTKQLEQENEILRRSTAYFARDVLPNDVPAGPRPR
jgi:transposase